MALTNAYSTMARFKLFVGLDDDQSNSEAELALNAASRQIDNHCGDRFYVDDDVSTRSFMVYDACEVNLPAFSTASGLIVKIDADLSGTFETTLTVATDFIVTPIDASVQSPARAYTGLRSNLASAYRFPVSSYGVPTLQVTAKWGWPAIPPDIEHACLLQARQLFKSSSATFGAFSLGDSGISMRVRKMDQVAEGLLEAYRRVEC